MEHRQLPPFMKSPRRNEGRRFTQQGNRYRSNRNARNARCNGSSSQEAEHYRKDVTFSIIEMEPEIRIGVKICPPSEKIASLCQVCLLLLLVYYQNEDYFILFF